MKILIAYDGSECSDAAVIDLRRAGLPKDAEVTIFSVADVPQQAYTVPVPRNWSRRF
ncbi:MAG: universal stress protein [Tepidisphaeraceae bacterium]